MNCFLFAVLFIAAPLASANYGSSSSGHGHGHGASYISSASSSGLDELVQAAAGGAHNSGSSIAPANTAQIQNESADAARLGQVQAQLEALNSNPVYRNLKSSDAIAESLAQSKLASSIRRGNINIVAPNVVDQGVYRSLLVPSGQNNHQVIATQALPPIVVNQPPQAPTVIAGGPAAVVKAAPVIYKIKPSVIYQQEVINKVPTPLSLNPVYVKVYKPGKKVDAPLVPGVQKTYAPSYSAPSYAPQSYDTAPASSYAAAPAPSYGAAQSHHSHHNYEAAPAASYGPAASYDSEPSYGPAPSASPSYGSAPASSGY